MNTIKLAATLALVVTSALASVACGGGGEPGKPGAAADKGGDTAPAGGTAVEGLPLVVDLPPGAEANFGGAGFHTEDKTLSVMIKATTDTDPKDFEAAKKASEEFLFKKWIKSEKTADGWILQFLGTGMNMEGKEYDLYRYSVVRKIGGKQYECSGGLEKAADFDKNIKLCQALKPAP